MEILDRFGGRRRERRLIEEATAAMAAAALDDPAFERMAIRQATAEIFHEAAHCWQYGARPRGRRGGKRARGRRPDYDVIIAWAHEMQAECGALEDTEGTYPDYEVLRVINRADPREARLVLRIWFEVIRHGRQRHRIAARWTLARDARRPTGWLLAAAGGDVHAAAAAVSEQIAEPFADNRLAQAALRERGEAGALADGVDPGDLIDPDLDASAALDELALLDDRFARALIDADLRQILDAWQDDPTPGEVRLRRVATRGAITDLRHGGWSVRDATLDSWEPVTVTTDPHDAELELRIIVTAMMHHPRLPDDDQPYRYELGWTLRRDGNSRHGTTWRLTGSRDLGRSRP